jgi:ATP-dependent exoDNAse (exonuclease V) beta subunit
MMDIENTNKPTLLSKKNAHPRDEYISFEEEGHKYTITDQSSSSYDKPVSYISVTTWIGRLFSKFNADEVIKNMKKSKKWNQSKYSTLSEEQIKLSWEKNRVSAANAGTKMHYDIECFYNGIVHDNKSIEYEYFKEYEKDRLEGLFSFTKEQMNMEAFRTEMTVYDEELYFAGSIDMLYKYDDGKLCICDWKRCKEIKKVNMWQHSNIPGLEHIPDTNYWHYTIQLNLYRYILEKRYNYEINDMYLVCLHPNNRNCSYIKIIVPILLDEMDILIEYRKNELKQNDRK